VVLVLFGTSARDATLSLITQDMAAIVISIAWILSISGWSTANRAFVLSGANSHLGYVG
jgi:hypothetical protein